MADVNVSIQEGVGVPPTHAPSYAGSLGSGDTYIVPNDGRTKLNFKKGSGSASVLTFTTPATYRGLAVTDPTVNIAINTEREVGPFDPELFGSSLNFSATNEANLSFAAVRA